MNLEDYTKIGKNNGGIETTSTADPEARTKREKEIGREATIEMLWMITALIGLFITIYGTFYLLDFLGIRETVGTLLIFVFTTICYFVGIAIFLMIKEERNGMDKKL